MFKLEKGEKTGPRLGKIETPHGVIETPAYVIVGTHGYVRTLEPEDLLGTKTQLIISNTFHLWQDLSEEGLTDFPGIHAFMGWTGPTMTDSGGFQVFSFGSRPSFAGADLDTDGAEKEAEKGFIPLEIPSTTGTGSDTPRQFLTGFIQTRPQVRITDAGVYFSVDGGGEQYLDAEISVRIQEQIGADIVVAFDEPTAPNANYEYTAEAMRRTHAWAERSLEARTSKQLMYGVIQGGTYPDLRAESARTIGRMEFDGFAIGGTYGDAYGGTKAQTRDMLAWSIAELPVNKPRHLFGVGRIEDLLDGVAAGIDTFDCVIPTREARHARLWTLDGHMDITKAVHAGSEAAVEAGCSCVTCSTVARGELHQMFKAKNPAGQRWATIHNVFFFNTFMESIRTAIMNGKFEEFRKDTLERLVSKGKE